MIFTCERKWNKYRRLATCANHGATSLLVHVKHESAAKIRHRKSENVCDSVVALIWCQTLMPVRFKGHCFQIHPVSVQQPLRSNMLRPSARKRLLTASKFPASPPSHRQRIRLPFFFLNFHWLIYVARRSQKLGADAAQSRCATSVLINLSPGKWNAQQ